MTNKLKITDPEVQDELKALALEIKNLRSKVEEMTVRIDGGYWFNYNDCSILEEDQDSEYSEEVYSVLHDILELLGNAQNYLNENKGLRVGYMSSYIHGRG
jgi:hypothetical protein